MSLTKGWGQNADGRPYLCQDPDEGTENPYAPGPEQSAGIVWACRLAMAGVDSAGPVSDRPLPASPYPAPTGKGAPPRLSILIGGYELVLCAAVSFVIECGLFLWLCLGADRGLSMPRLIATSVLALAVHALLLANGFIRIVATSEQLGILWRVLFLLFGGCRFSTSSCLGRSAGPPGKNPAFEMVKLETFLAEKENEICKTRYPILLVHGIFFRDWQMFNYWGRIPGNCRETAPPCSMAGSNPLPRWRQAQPN